MSQRAFAPILFSLRLFVHDFAAFAGTAGLLALLFVFLGAIVEGIGLVLLIPFFSVVIDTQNTGGWVQNATSWVFALFAADSRLAKLSLIIAGFAILMIARAIVLSVRDVMIAKLQVGFAHRIRSRITQHLAAARWETLARLRHSRITHLLGTEIQVLESASYIVLRGAVTIVMLASQIALAFLLAPLLAALALGIVLLGAATLGPLLRRARRIGQFMSDTNLSLIDNVGQFLGALKLAISQNLQDNFTREFDATLSDLRERYTRYIRQQTTIRLAGATLFGLVGAAAILLGIVVLNVSVSVLITLLLILSRMNAPTMQLYGDLQQLTQTVPSYEKLRELESDLTSAESKEPARPAVIPDLPTGPIVFKKVCFLHQAAAQVSDPAGGVRDLGVVIEPGEVVGVTGASGAGKTTFADLLVGLYRPQSGEILIGGAGLDGLLVPAWRNSVSYVAQDPFLFHDTIRRNFLWVKPNAEDAELWEALRIAGAEEIVRNAAHGLETVVGERGGRLSGGERQRLCLARALLRCPRLLVLDEATNAIDVEGEHAIFGRLLHATPDLTIVVIAHRTETLSHCDRILVFDRGRMVSDSGAGHRRVAIAARAS